jgi:hypothetical protein
MSQPQDIIIVIVIVVVACGLLAVRLFEETLSYLPLFAVVGKTWSSHM